MICAGFCAWAKGTPPSRYLGYTFKPWYEDPTNVVNRPGGTPMGFAPRAALPLVATFYPNPSSGAVQVVYQLPAGIERGQVEVYDQLGRLSQQVELTGSGGEATLQLEALPTGLYAYRVVAGGRILQTGKVVKLP